MVLALALWPPWGAPPRYAYAIAAGLVCSLAGDVLLMLPRDCFLHGLVAFMLAHVSYIVAFAYRAPWGLYAQPLLVGVLLVGLTDAVVGRRAGSLRWPVLAYALAIVTMAYGAWASWAAGGRCWRFSVRACSSCPMGRWP
ncbi:MAG: lysoplasmalogenase [Chloroflexota bacterium]